MIGSRLIEKGVWMAIVSSTWLFAIALDGRSQTSNDHPDLISNHRQRQNAERVAPDRSKETGSESRQVSKIKNRSENDSIRLPDGEASPANSEAALIDKTMEPPNQTRPVNSGWEFEVTPYFYATGIKGPVAARGRTLDLDASFAKLFDDLDLQLAGTFEIRKNRFVSLNDVIWIKLSNARTTAGGLYDTAKIGINLVIIDPEAGYRVVNSRSGSLDVLGGARIWSLEANLNTTSGRLQGFDVSQRKTWAAPVVGARGRFNLAPMWFLEGKFDIGGGLGADLTTQVYAGGGYRFSPHVGLIGGYRYLQVDYDDNEGFLFNTKKSGIVLGVRCSF
jgi:hypothetical protein